MEIVRLAGAPFSDQELETINSYLVWGSMVLALADKVLSVRLQLSRFTKLKRYIVEGLSDK